MEPVDRSTLPGPAQKILDPKGPPPLKAMAAKGLVPGLKPGDVLLVMVLLAEGSDAAAATAKATLDNLPDPLLNGALSGPLHPYALHALSLRCADDPAKAERVLHHESIAPESVVLMASKAHELVCELIATNEELLLATPEIIEKLYMNKRARMSTADRILELAVRNEIELRIPAYAAAAQAIKGELIIEPTDEPTFDDVQFAEAQAIAEQVALGEDEDTHQFDEETGEEQVIEVFKPLHAVWTELRPPGKIRLVQLGNMEVDGEERSFDAKAIRMLGVRDANPLVALASIQSPGIADSEVVRISGMRNVHDDVLREIAKNRDWTRHYMIKFNLVANPRTPFTFAAQFLVHLRDNDLKTLSKSKEVAGAVAMGAKQRLLRKAKGK